MTIRQKIKNLARRLSGVRYIGRPVRIMAAIARLPYYHERQHYFETQQLPGLLHALSDVNGRQQLLQKDIVGSIPVTLRALRREQVDLRASIMSEIEGVRLREGELRDVQSSLHIELSEARSDLRSELSETQSGLRSELQSIQDSLRSELARVAEGASENATSLGNMRESVQYLLGRVEYVRRELMFEMRYGAKSHELAKGDEGVDPQILSQEKLEQARQSVLRVNMGCGHVLLDGYLNIDRRALPGVDVVAELDNMPFQQGEIDEIFSAHVIEHFPQEQLIRQLLPYWSGLLKPGGKFAAVVPDAQGMIDAYHNGEYSFDQFRTVMLGGQDYDGDFHFAMFTPQSLTNLLIEAGFEDVVVHAANRENAGCKEFEISATRPNR